MLLSILLSFVSSKLLRGKAYVLMILAFLIPATFLSVGGPRQWPNQRDFAAGGPTIFPTLPFPFSFPVYASFVIDRHDDVIYYRLSFLNYVLSDRWIFAKYSLSPPLFNFPSFYYVLYFSFFMLINVFGAMIGYWLGKSAFIDRRINSMKQRIHTRIPKREA